MRWNGSACGKLMISLLLTLSILRFFLCCCFNWNFNLHLPYSHNDNVKLSIRYIIGIIMEKACSALTMTFSSECITFWVSRIVPNDTLLNASVLTSTNALWMANRWRTFGKRSTNLFVFIHWTSSWSKVVLIKMQNVFDFLWKQKPFLIPKMAVYSSFSSSTKSDYLTCLVLLWIAPRLKQHRHIKFSFNGIKMRNDTFVWHKHTNTNQQLQSQTHKIYGANYASENEIQIKWYMVVWKYYKY